MAPNHKLLMEIAEQCRIPPLPSPALQRPQPPPLPLTFYDLVFLRFSPVQRLFFYHYRYSTHQFIACELPNLKHSLSLALRHFYPLAGTLTIEAQKPPEILCSINDSVSFTLAISHANFFKLSSNLPRDVTDFHSLVPPLASSGDEVEVLAVQVTVFPNVGVAIGTTVHHAVADGSTYSNFMKTWASMCRLGPDSAGSYLPSLDRSVVRDPRGLKSIFLKDLELLGVEQSLQVWDLYGCPSPVVRATFTFSCNRLDKLGSRTSTKCSPYSLACGYIWACLTKARPCSRSVNTACKEYFGFVTGCRARHDPPLPAAYFGNCLGICCVEAKTDQLVGENGAVVAAEAIWEVIKNLAEHAFTGAENWIKDVSDYASAKALTVAGSPKLGVYEVDFGWGRPKKVELVSIERTGALALAEARDEEGGIEVGLALPKHEMDRFAAIFAEGLID